jgi:DNA repair exonuclease SbcCD ATPase subunit
MGIFDKINGKHIEQKVSEYSEVYGEVLLGVHREVKSLDAKVQFLSVLVVDDGGQTSANVGIGTRVLALQTQLRAVERRLNEANAEFDREIPELRHNHEAIVSRVTSLDAGISQRFTSIQAKSEDLQSSLAVFLQRAEAQFSEVRADSSMLSGQLVKLKENLEDLGRRVGRQADDLYKSHADHRKLEGRVQSAELGLESAAASIRVLVAAGETTDRELDAIRRTIRMTVRIGAGISSVLFVLF